MPASVVRSPRAPGRLGQVSIDPHDPPADVRQFLTDRHLASLTTVRRNGSLHVVAVGFTYEVETATVRVITSDGSVKVRNAERPRPDGSAPRAAVCSVDGPSWISLEGPCSVLRDPDAVADAERRYAARYREPRPNPRRVVLTISVEQMLGSARLR